MFKEFWYNEQGMVLPLAVMMLAVFTVLGFSAVFLVDSQGTLGKHVTDRSKALHYAEAGIHAYLGHVNKRQNVDWEAGEAEIPFEDGFYKIQEVIDQENNLFRVIRSTGWVKGNEDNARTIEVSIGRVAFNQYAMFSGTDAGVNWTTGDKCYGPYHTNDTLHIDGNPVFYGPVTYVNRIQRTKGTPVFREGHRQVPPLNIPEDNYQLKERAAEGGHIYYGRTRILLNGNTYKVKYQTETGEKTETRSLPENGVIYVDAGKQPVTNPGNKFDSNLGNVFISGELSGNLTIGAANEIYITGNDPTIDDWQTAKNRKTPRNNEQGLVYRDTTFVPIDEHGNESNSDANTVGYKHDTSSGNDLLGLVANNDIRILGKGWFNNHNPFRGWRWVVIIPVWHEDPEYNVAPQDITIHGAVFSIQEGFGYESYSEHNKGSITLRGSLIQKTRKAVGTVGGLGYTKNYAHDPRMLYATPPSFPEPLNTGWEIKDWIVDPDN